MRTNLGGVQMPEESVYESLKKEGVSRRDFLKLCGVMAGTMGLNAMPPLEKSGLPSSLNVTEAKSIERIAKAMETQPRLPVIWLEFQDCTGCSESLTRANAPTLGNLVLNTLTIEHHEALSAAAGFQVEEAKQQAMEKYAGQYILVVEGSIPTGEHAAYCAIGGRTAEAILEEAAAGAAAIIAIGNCAAFGGLPKAKPNPTNAASVLDLVKDKAVVNLPGCPPIPEAIVGVITHFALFGVLPELDKLNRPVAFYGKTVHDRCLRRPFYEAGKFALSFDDEGAREGWCLFKLGCKGPTTYNACASIRWDSGLSFPIQSNHPCLGCSEPDFWDGPGFYQGLSAPLNKPAATAVGAAAAAGIVAGVAVGAANKAQKKNAASKEE